MARRYAIVRNADSRQQAEAYLPSNYTIIRETPGDLIAVNKRRVDFVIAGEDKAGWTLDDYVIPRFASGLIWAEEVPATHPLVTNGEETS